jgi:hypothetical protein
MSMSGKVTAGSQVITMTGDGDFQNNPTLGELTMSVSGGLRNLTMQAVMEGTTMYMTSDFLRAGLPGGKTWMSMDIAKATKALGVDLGSMSSQSPTQALAQLRKNAAVAEVGHETLDGVDTTHYTAVIDSAYVSKLRKALGETVTYAPVDVWIGSDNLVRRIRMSYSQSGTAAVPASAMEMTMDLSHYGEPVRVSVPSPDETFDVTDLATQAFK